MLSEEFRERLRHGKYTDWAAELTDDQLQAVLWAVGEYGVRARVPLEVLNQHSPRDPISHARAVLALETLSDFTDGRFIDVQQYFNKVQQIVATFYAAREERRSKREGARDE